MNRTKVTLCIACYLMGFAVVTFITAPAPFGVSAYSLFFAALLAIAGQLKPDLWV